MQAQQLTPSPRQRLRAGEIAIALFNLLVFGAGGYFGLFYVSVAGYRDWTAYFTSSTFPFVTALVAGLSCLLILLRARRAASFTSYLAAASLEPNVVMLFYVNRFAPDHTFHDSVADLVLVALPYQTLALLFIWFGWLLRRMDA